ncbi:MAG: PLP-dependent aminotransferase family protein [Acidobacteriia bacterium]|nr:PLP-dependent aminotransferase family protein [Terriglobia bacterium]
MRRSQGVLLPPVRVARPRRGDVYRTLRAAVLDGVLSAGERLPSTRQAAADYGVSRGMLEEVFAQLTEEGFMERAVGRGTFVALTVSRLSAPAKQKQGPRRSPTPSRRGHSVAANAACREPAVPSPFNAGIADTSEFPWKMWQRLMARSARELGHGALNFADPRGLPNLRVAIARYLAQFRGIRCQPGQVIVFNSAQQALNALAVLLLDRGDAVWIEDPCYLGARAAFELAGAAITPVPVDDEGIRADTRVRRSARARLTYVTPSHQYPTGVALGLERRIALLEVAERDGSWVVEDDYDGEFRYEGQPLTALYSLDSQGRVLYIGTLNKSMFVSLRLAYAVVPEELVESLANIRTQLDGFTPAVRQMAMSLFMDEGHFSSHLRRMRAVYGAKRAALVEGLAPLAALGWTWSSNPAGMHLLVRHKRGDYVRAVATASSLDLALLSAYRIARTRDDGLFLRFGALDTASLSAGIAALVAVAKKMSR